MNGNIVGKGLVAHADVLGAFVVGVGVAGDFAVVECVNVVCLFRLASITSVGFC